MLLAEHERWVGGFEGRYSVTSNGFVFRWAWAGRERARMSAQLGRGGYWHVNLSCKGRKLKRYVHRLVADAFVAPVAGKQVDHFDNNKSNNCAENLRVVTQLENLKKQHSDGLCAHGERARAARLTADLVRGLRAARQQPDWNAREWAIKLSVGVHTIRNAVSGRTWKHVE